MGYRLMAWNGDFRTKDMFSASGREYREFTRKPEALAAAKAFIATYAPKGEAGRVILEETSRRYGSKTLHRWTVERLSAAPWLRWHAEQ